MHTYIHMYAHAWDTYINTHAHIELILFWCGSYIECRPIRICDLLHYAFSSSTAIVPNGRILTNEKLGEMKKV